MEEGILLMRASCSPSTAIPKSTPCVSIRGRVLPASLDSSINHRREMATTCWLPNCSGNCSIISLCSTVSFSRPAIAGAAACRPLSQGVGDFRPYGRCRFVCLVTVRAITEVLQGSQGEFETTHMLGRWHGVVCQLPYLRQRGHSQNACAVNLGPIAFKGSGQASQIVVALLHLAAFEIEL